MTDDQRQRLSALVDGEGSGPDWQRAIDDAIEDAGQRGRFERYLIIRRAIRGEPLSVPVRQVATRVAATIAQGPPGVAMTDVGAAGAAVGERPQIEHEIRHATATIPQVRAPAPGRRRRPAAARPLIGLALAAGFVLLAVVVGPRLLLETGAAVPLFAGNAGLPNVIERWRVADDGVTKVNVIRGTDLEHLLVSHRERSAATGLAGYMPYATLVGYSGAR